MRKRLVLHAGFTKTGTKSLQDCLYQNRERLAEQGIRYSAEITDQFSAAHWVLMAVLMFPTNRNIAKYSDVLFQFLDDERDGCHTLVLSHEGILNRVYCHEPAGVEALNRLHQPFHVDIFAVRREREKWLPSTYRQSIVNKRNDNAAQFSPADRFGTGDTYAEFLTHRYTDKLSDHCAALEHLGSLLEPRDKCVARYEDDWFAVFRNFLDPNLDWLELPKSRKNVAIPFVYLDILRQLNRQKPPVETLSAVKAAIKQVTGVDNVQVNREALEFEQSGGRMSDVVNAETLGSVTHIDNPPLIYAPNELMAAKSALIGAARSYDQTI